MAMRRSLKNNYIRRKRCSERKIWGRTGVRIAPLILFLFVDLVDVSLSTNDTTRGTENTGEEEGKTPASTGSATGVPGLPEWLLQGMPQGLDATEFNASEVFGSPFGPGGPADGGILNGNGNESPVIPQGEQQPEWLKKILGRLNGSGAVKNLTGGAGDGFGGILPGGFLPGGGFLPSEFLTDGGGFMNFTNLTENFTGGFPNFTGLNFTGLNFTGLNFTGLPFPGEGFPGVLPPGGGFPLGGGGGFPLGEGGGFPLGAFAFPPGDVPADAQDFLKSMFAAAQPAPLESQDCPATSESVCFNSALPCEACCRNDAIPMGNKLDCWAGDFKFVSCCGVTKTRIDALKLKGTEAEPPLLDPELHALADAMYENRHTVFSDDPRVPSKEICPPAAISQCFDHHFPCDFCCDTRFGPDGNPYCWVHVEGLRQNLSYSFCCGVRAEFALDVVKTPMMVVE